MVCRFANPVRRNAIKSNPYFRPEKLGTEPKFPFLMRVKIFVQSRFLVLSTPYPCLPFPSPPKNYSQQNIENLEVKAAAREYAID